MKYTFIVNPTSGNLNSQQLLDLINLYKHAQPEFEFDIHLTQYRKHATQLAASIKGENQVVVACGGDGTINEVLNGLNPEVTFAIMPIGSGNDFFRNIVDSEKLDFKQLLHDTLSGSAVMVDYVVANEQRFLNISNMGLDAQVSVDFAQKRGGIISQKMLYTALAIPAVLKAPHSIYKVQLDEQAAFEIDATFIAVCNGQYYGGGFHCAPMADIQDGYLDIVICKKAKPMQLIPLFGKYKKGQHLGAKIIETYKAKQVTISKPQPFVYVNDGEIFQSEKLQYSCIKQGLKLLIPKNSLL